MDFKGKLLEIRTLQKEIDLSGVLDPSLKKQINYSFSLDWNFYSNSIEGNSLTKNETRQVMMGISVGNKPFKDLSEMNGHKLVVEEIMNSKKDPIRISEQKIRDFHKEIIYEENQKKQDQVGEWKKENNYIINYKGERHDFVHYSEVPDEMHNLVNRSNEIIDKINLKPENVVDAVELAFMFHLEFIKIHPFYDGNGRTARLLNNLLLVNYGFPPVIVNDVNKDLYVRNLAEVIQYGAEPNLFFTFMSDLLIESQKIMLESIVKFNQSKK